MPSSCTACPPTAAKRSAPRSSTAPNPSSGTRQKTECTCKRHSWSTFCWVASAEQPPPAARSARPHGAGQAAWRVVLDELAPDLAGLGGALQQGQQVLPVSLRQGSPGH